jgi:serine protease inhibitor
MFDISAIMNFQSSSSNHVNRLAVGLYNTTTSGLDENFVMSSLSVYIAMFMCYFGARSATAGQLARVLDIAGAKSGELRNFASKLSNTNEVLGRHVTFKSANKIFPNISVDMNRKYADLLKTDFKSQVSPLDFSNPITASDTINDWIARNTNQNIRHMLSPDDLSINTFTSGRLLLENIRSLNLNVPNSRLLK